MILQWVMGQEELDGIRYFSTRFLPAEDTVAGSPTTSFRPCMGPARKQDTSLG